MMVYLVKDNGVISKMNNILLLIAIYFVMSLLTFLIYAWDKRAAQKGNWRTKESTLHLLSLIGGWPGALIAQNRLRHKSKKQPFKTIFWITVFSNNILLVLIYMPDSLLYLQNLLSNIMH